MSLLLIRREMLPICHSSVLEAAPPLTFAQTTTASCYTYYVQNIISGVIRSYLAGTHVIELITPASLRVDKSLRSSVQSYP